LGSGSDHEDRPKKIRKKKAVEIQIYKSAAFIVDSDDDEEADAAFFARERELRAEMEALAAKQGSTMLVTGTKKRKKKGKDKGKKDHVTSPMPEINGNGDHEMDHGILSGEAAMSPSYASELESSEDEITRRIIQENRGYGPRMISSGESGGDSEGERPTRGVRGNGRKRMEESDEDD